MRYSPIATEVSLPVVTERGQFQGLKGGAAFIFSFPSLSNERHACMSPNEATQRFLFPDADRFVLLFYLDAFAAATRNFLTEL